MTLMTPPPLDQQQQQQQPDDDEMLVPHTDFPEGPQPMEVAQAETANTVDTQAVDDPPSARFTWTIENFSRLNNKKLYSDTFFVGGYKWRILIFPKGNNVDHLSMYLDVADSATLPYGWSRYAQFSLSVINQIHNKYSIRKETQHQFNARESDWGFTSFMPLGELYDPGRGYLVNDTCIVEADVAVRRVVDYWSHDSKKETGYVGLKNQGATCYMNSLLQTLYHIPYFRKAVYHMPTTENDMPSGSIPLALQSLFYKLQYSDTSVATKELTKSFGWDTYDSFMQHDVQELNRVLCEKLEDKMKGTVVEGTIQQLFEGHHMNYIECINVDYKSTRKESFYDLQLDVKGCRDVYASFDKYVEVERLEGDNKYHAEQYGLQDARKGVLFIDFPPVLQLQLKRFEYDFMRDTMVKINDRYEFPLQLDLDRENGKYLSPDADRSVRNLYTLHSVLVHSGGVHGGHYYAFIRPTLSDQWFKFDDERVTKEDVKRALEEQYGGEEELPPTNPGFNNSPFKFTKYSNAYMLVYIRESDKDKIICNVDEKDIAEHLRIRLKKEQEEKEQKRKEKAEAHLYTIIKVARNEDLLEQIGRDIYFDLVDHEKVHSFRIQKQMPFNVFKEEVAKEFGIPVQFQRFWFWAKRQNHTYRPNRPLTPQEEVQSVGQLREVSNKANNAELKLFLEVELGQDLKPVPPPEKTKEDILLFFKLYEPLKEMLQYVGRLFVKGSGKPVEILAKLNEMAGFSPDEEIEIYEEIKFEPNIMKVLSLSRNNFSGSISPQLALTSALVSLNLSRNSLSGRIPVSLVNMSTIRVLDLSENSFSGAVPDNLFQNCLSLRQLSLAGNMLEGSIPSTLPRCSLLNSLNLSKNRFSGTLDFTSGIWTLKRLRVLDLSKNALSGPVPNGIAAIHYLKEFLLSGNHFSGPLPVDTGLCPHLYRLDFGDNRFTGALPDSLQRLNSLIFFRVSNNMLTGDFPSWIGNMSSLEYLDFSRNSLAGNLPSSMGELKSLKYLSLSHNKLGGNIPMSLVYCTGLSVIHLGGNSFDGRIPESFFDLGLEEIDFSGNKLMGSIPRGSSRIYESLHKLDMSRNNLTGSIPAEMGLFSNLRYLNLSWNNLKSRVPPELGFFPNLTILDLRNSALYGSIPGEICDSGSLGILQLDGNALMGSIPEEIGNCTSIYLLSLSHNDLNGSIPKSISNLNKLKILQLEFNELSGEIPQELGRLQNLLAVNISYNRLEGRLPVGGIFPNLDQSSLQGNLGICSPLLKGPCKLNVPKPLVLNPNAFDNPMGDHKQRNRSSKSKEIGRHNFLSVSAIVAISAAILITFGVIVIALLNVSARRRLIFVDNALESLCSSSSRSGSAPTGKLVLFDSRSSPDLIGNPEPLLNKASEIGGGMFGTVYKVPLGTQGRMVAIKKLVTSNIIRYPEDFDREVRVLGKAEHPNLIKLKGYYWAPQTQLLVSEFAPNGSLQSKLHERLPSVPPLSWAERFKILLGTAKGLAHLHHSFRPPIIHYNIKPSNILLDENHNPKISDFGLARLLTELEKHIISNRFQSALGYVAPELACQSLRVNEKCDIYGFGVMILEVVTGKRPVEYGEDNVVILSDHMRFSLEQGNALDCVDPSMSEYPEDEVLPVLKLALVCTSQIPSSRPSMEEVVHILQLIKTPAPQRTGLYY